ncbi:hypothetical protein PROFUN_03803 [Planoprotostelium fungivorum]|uniref:THUMP domain-containing protein n=1 Tax=Planoprotostelium fungivorum TaxID=1890364 RepID=A0A2P6NI62_9EUKA|nr:hypothetical protein PROFUN_03803 [Planoprotostelium fungivorum]
MSKRDTETELKTDVPAKKQKSEEKKPGVPNRGRFAGAKKHALMFKASYRLRGIMLATDQNREDRAYGSSWYPETTEETERARIRDEERAKKRAAKGEESEEKQISKPKQVKRFTVYDCGIKGNIFLELLPEAPFEPEEFVKRLLSMDELSKYEKKLQNTHRLIPIQAVACAEMKDILECAKDLIEKHLGPHANAEPKKTFGIMINLHNNKTMKRTEIINQVAELVGTRLAVNLKSPDFSIIIEIVKDAAAMSIVTEFFQYHKFNVHSMAKNTGGKQEEGTKE